MAQTSVNQSEQLTAQLGDIAHQAPLRREHLKSGFRNRTYWLAGAFFALGAAGYYFYRRSASKA